MRQSSDQMPVPAVFLDRDGVINRPVEDGYVTSWQAFVFLPGALEALCLLHGLRAPVFVVTNQSCVHRGLLAARDLDRIHWRMCRAIQSAGGAIDGVYVCPHRPDEGCACRKPAPGLLLQAAHAHGIAPTASWMIGDSASDVIAGHSAGCRTILVGDPGGDAGRELPQREVCPTTTVDCLLDASRFLARRYRDGLHAPRFRRRYRGRRMHR